MGDGDNQGLNLRYDIIWFDNVNFCWEIALITQHLLTSLSHNVNI